MNFGGLFPFYHAALPGTALIPPPGLASVLGPARDTTVFIVTSLSLGYGVFG